MKNAAKQFVKAVGITLGVLVVVMVVVVVLGLSFMASQGG